MGKGRHTRVRARVHQLTPLHLDRQDNRSRPPLDQRTLLPDTVRCLDSSLRQTVSGRGLRYS